MEACRDLPLARRRRVVIGRLTALALAPLIAGLSPAATPNAPSPAAAPQGSSARVASALAQVTPTGATLADSMIAQRWRWQRGGGVSVSALIDRSTGQDWARAGGADFSLVVDSVPTSSLAGWRLLGVRALLTPPDPARPQAGRGVQIAFRYGLAVRSGLIELERTWTLYPGAAVEGVSEQIVNRTPAVVRIGAYTLAQLSSSAPVSAEVQTYHGGSDWRQD